jgi:hypothetical protein
MKVSNSAGADLFLPDATAAERLSVYNNLNRPNITVFKGQYHIDSQLYRNTAIIGTGPCWFGNSDSATYNTPAACPAGWTEGTPGLFGSTLYVSEENNINPNDYVNDGTIRHKNVSWMSFQVLDYGCPTNAYAKLSVRYCRV